MRSTMMDSPLTISSMLRHGRALYADRQVFTFTGVDTPPRSRTFAEVAERVDRLAEALQGLGIGDSDRVGTFMWNTAEHLEAYLAIPSMGAVLHTLNIRLFPEQVVYIANHAEDKIILTDHSLLKLLLPLLPELKTVETVIVANGPLADAEAGRGAATQTFLSYEDLLAEQTGSFAWPADIDETSAAAMCYTSGTTGNPKGVAYSHRSTWLHAMAATTSNGAAISAGDRLLPIVPMFHANAWGYPYAGWIAGADIAFPAHGMVPEALASYIHAVRPTMSAGVPTIFNDLLRWGESHQLDLSSFRQLFCGGSAVPLALMKRCHDQHGLEIIQGWGMTETSPVAAIAIPPESVEEFSDEYWHYRTSAGRLCFGVEGRLVAEDGSQLPHDGTSVGELEVRGPWVTGSYYGDDDADKFDDGWLKTGDVGSLTDNGFIFISDRSKDVIKSGGEWISSVDLENALAGHPSVLEAAVVGVPDEQWEERPLAAVVLAEGAEVSPEELRTFLGGKVAKWWLPERWAFIDAVPKTSVGKFDKKVLRGQYADGDLDVTTLGGSTRG
jgi:fatty-acyl-CoA synthase